MSRRDAMKKFLILAAAFGFSRPALAFQTQKISRRGEPVSFKNGVYSAALQNGTWNLWVRPDPRNINVLTVRLQLQVAEDSEFKVLVSKEVLVAHRKTGYIVKKNFKSPSAKRPLYFRYLVLPKNKFEYPNEVQVSQVGIMKPIS